MEIHNEAHILKIGVTQNKNPPSNVVCLDFTISLCKINCLIKNVINDYA